MCRSFAGLGVGCGLPLNEGVRSLLITAHSGDSSSVSTHGTLTSRITPGVTCGRSRAAKVDACGSGSARLADTVPSPSGIFRSLSQCFCGRIQTIGSFVGLTTDVMGARVNLFSGIGLGLYMLMISVSGSAIVFRREITRLSWTAPTVRVTGAMMSAEQLTAAAKKLISRIMLNYKLMHIIF